MKNMIGKMLKPLRAFLIAACGFAFLFLSTTAYASSDCVVDIPVTVTCTGPVPGSMRFSCEITAITPGAPLPVETVIKIAPNTEETFKGITYSKAETYEYEIRQLQDRHDPKLTYDATVYRLFVQTIYDENNQLKAEIWALTEPDQKKIPDLVFTNQYREDPAGGGEDPEGTSPEKPQTPAPGEHTPEEIIESIVKDFVSGAKTGDSAHILLYIAIMIGSAVLLTCYSARKRVRENDSTTDYIQDQESSED